jgi:tRNA(Ile)-lysidine synthase
VRFPVGALAAAPAPVAARALRHALTALEPPYPPDRAVVERLLELAAGPGSRALDVSGRIVARRHGPWLEISRRHDQTAPAPVELSPPGSVRWGRYRLETIIGPPPVPAPMSCWSLAMPLTGNLVIRPGTSSDRIRITFGHKLVFDALAEAGIPPPERKHWPVVESEGEIVWIPGVRRAVCAPTGDDRYLWATMTEDAAWEPYEP